MSIACRFLSTALFAAVIGAAPLAPAQTADETHDGARQKACSQAATEHRLTGETRQAFLADCLAGKASAAPAAGSETCGARAKKADQQKLKGEERRLFMSGCLKRS